MIHAPDLAVVPALRNERLRSVGALAHEDVLQSLKTHRLPARLLYDPTGFDLLERAWDDPAFYPARLERDLLTRHLADLAASIGPNARVIEPWHGGLARTIQILGALRPAVYIPVDGDPARLADHAATLRVALPDVDIQPALTFDDVLPRTPSRDRTIALLPGTALATLEPTAAVRLLTLLAAIVGEDGSLLLGADATSDPIALAAAYDTPGHARWALHAVATLATDPDAFTYRTAWMPAASRLDLVLVARHAVTVADLALAAGDTLTIDHRYQHGTESMNAMLGIAGWQQRTTLSASPQPMRIWLCDRWHRGRRR